MVESTLVRNINNNRISASDVPYIISIIAQLYNLLLTLNIDYNIHNEMPADTCGYILKFVFSVVIRENIVKIDDDTNSTLLILCCDDIVDSCTRLLKLKPMISVQKPPKPTRVPPVEVEPLHEKKNKQVKTDCCC